MLTYYNGAEISYDYEDYQNDDDLSNRIEKIDNDIGGVHLSYEYPYDKEQI